jgi:hypothetical protein
MVCGLGQLPITLIRMITHGYEDKRYVKLSNELWPNDVYFIVKLLLQFLKL